MEFPEDSEILIPAKEKPEIDWNMANRLAEENKDFKNYLSKVDIFCEKPTEAVIESIPLVNEKLSKKSASVIK